MAYSSGGLIEASDYNGFAASVNAVWGSGSGDSGYGQSNTLSTVAVSNTVTASQWATLIARIDSMRQHQSGVTSGLTQPTTGDTIEFLNTLSTQVGTITTNRFLRNVGTTSAATALASNTWGGTTEAVRECSMTWGSSEQMRYFFNTGGTVTFNAVNSSFSGNAKSDNWDVIANNCATATITASVFWNNLSTSNYTVTSQIGTTTGGYDYNSNVLYLQARLNAAPGSSTVLTLRGYFVDGASDFFDDNVSGTARIDATANAPATTYITNTWGTITGANDTLNTQS